MKHHLRKAAAVLLILIMVFSLSGCYKKYTPTGKITLPRQANLTDGRIIMFFDSSLNSKTAATQKFDNDEFFYIEDISPSPQATYHKQKNGEDYEEVVEASARGILHRIDLKAFDRVLCETSDFPHNSADCEAYISGKYDLFTYQGVLYGIVSKDFFGFYRFDLNDLQNPRLVSKTTVSNIGHIGADLAAADNCLYTAVSDSKGKILKTDLESGQTSVFFTLPNGETSPSILAIFDGYMIVASNNIHTAPTPTEFWAVSLSGGESQLVKSLDAMLSVGEKSGCIFNRKLYYIDTVQNALISFDFLSGEEKVVSENILDIQEHHTSARTLIYSLQGRALLLQYLYGTAVNPDKVYCKNLMIDLISGKCEPLGILTTSGISEPVPPEILGQIGNYFIGHSGDEYILMPTDYFMENKFIQYSTIREHR